MRTQVAILHGLNEKWSIEEAELAAPRSGEVCVRMVAAGLCHTEEHLVTGYMPVPFPIVGGHEGAGVVEEVGPGVTELEPGDHVVLTFIPSCGRCRWCVTGKTNLCDLGAHLLTGTQLDGTHRVSTADGPIGQFLLVGTFATYTIAPVASVVKIDRDIPLEKAALVGCGVATGFGSAVHAAGVQPGDTVVVMGAGGIGINAIQGARIAGAQWIIAIDPVGMKREVAQEFGATHVAAGVGEAVEIITEVTRGAMAERAIITTDTTEPSYIRDALSLVGKTGRVVVTAIAHHASDTADMSIFDLTLYEKELRGAVYGSCNPRRDIPLILSLYQSGDLKLDELVTRTYRLSEINEGYRDLLEGRNLRGLIVFD
jgi:NDMA-dependent alcohol dehydrogenase